MCVRTRVHVRMRVCDTAEESQVSESVSVSSTMWISSSTAAKITQVSAPCVSKVQSDLKGVGGERKAGAPLNAPCMCVHVHVCVYARVCASRHTHTGGAAGG